MNAKAEAGPESFGPSARFKTAWIWFMAALASLPYLFCFWQTPTGFTYSWMLPPYSADSYGYRVWIEQAYRGDWLFSLKFTAVPHRPFLFQPFFLACGLLARILGLNTGILLLGVKAAGVVLFFRTLFAYLEHLRLDRVESTAAAVLAGVSSGFGGFAVQLVGRERALQLLGRAGEFSRDNPLDLWLIDSNTFWSLLWNPLFPFSLTLIVLSVLLGDKAAEGGRAREAWLCGLCVGLLALIHPYPVAVLIPLLSLLSLFKPKSPAFSILGRILAAAAPAVIYVAGISRLHPLLQRHNLLATMPKPTFPACVLGFGLPLCLAVCGLFLRRKDFIARYWPLWAWFLMALGLSFGPFWFGPKLLFGAHIPLCILAAIFCAAVLRRLPERRLIGAGAAGVLLALVPFSHVIMFRECLREFRQNPDGDYWIDGETMSGLRFLAANSRPSDIVFAAAETSPKIAAYSGNTVLWGHWAQSVDFNERMVWFVGINSDRPGESIEDRVKEFWAPGIDYLFLDRRTRAMFRRDVLSALTVGADKVFENGQVAIYRRSGA